MRSKRRGANRDSYKSGRRSWPYDDPLLGAWFLPKALFTAIRHLLPREYWNRMGYFYEDYGCLVCRRKDRRHYANGMCQNCGAVVRYRVVKSLRKRKKKLPPVKIDSKEKMREKLLASKRKKANEILADFPPRREQIVRRSNLKSRSWRTENVEMPFGVVGIRC